MSYTESRISSAIRECVHYCLHATSIVTGIAKFVAELRNSGEWQEAEIQLVERGVRHVFSGLVTRAAGSSVTDRSINAQATDSQSTKSNGI
jgi:hypothetical protein